jgi:hypothetical protein
VGVDEVVLHGDDVPELVAVRVTASTVAVPRRFVAEGLELADLDRDGEAVAELEIVCVIDSRPVLVAETDAVSLNCPLADALALEDSHALIVDKSETLGEYEAELLHVSVTVAVRDEIWLYDMDVDILRVTEPQREGDVDTLNDIVALDDTVAALTLGHNTVQYNNKIKARSMTRQMRNNDTTLLN